MKTGQLRQTLPSNSGKILDLEIAPDNQTTVSGASDRTMLRIWSLNANTKSPKVLKYGSEPKIVRVTQDGKIIMRQL